MWFGFPLAAAAPVVAADPETELLQGLARLARTPEFVELVPPNAFTRAFDRHFRRWRKHPAVVATRSLAADGVRYQEPASLALARSLGAPTDVDGLDPVWTDERLATYLPLVDAFREEADWDGFWAHCQPWIAAIEQHFRAGLTGDDPARWFSGLFGDVEPSSVQVVPSPLAGMGNYGVSLLSSDGATFRRAVVGVVVEGDDVVVDVELVAHEFAHGWVGPWVQSHPEVIPTLAAAPGPAATEHYADPAARAEELVTRAVTRLWLADHRPDLSWKAEWADREQGFTAARTVFLVLSTNRDPAGHLDVDQALERAAAAVAASDASRFAGPFGDVAVPSRIVPSAALVDEAQALTARFREQRRAISVEPAGERPRADDGGTWILGAPSSHPWAAAEAQRAGIVFEGDGVTVAGRHVSGSRLVVVAAVPAEGAPNRGNALVVAATDQDLVGAMGGTWMLHGYDWQVGRWTPGGVERVAGGWFSPGP